MSEDEFLEQLAQCLTVMKINLEVMKPTDLGQENRLIKLKQINERSIELFKKRRKEVINEK